MKLIDKFKYFDEHEIRFLDKNLIHYGKKNNNKIEYISLLGRTFEEKFYDGLLKQISNEHDYIFVVRAGGIGEVYLSCLMIDEIIKNNNAKFPCVIIHRSIFKDIFKMFNQYLPCYYLENLNQNIFNEALHTRFFKYKEKKFHVIQCTLKESVELFERYKECVNLSYPEAILEFSKVKEFKKIVPSISEEDKKIIKYIKNINLNNFIFFIPEANAVESYNEEFWYFLAKKLKDRGYDIFVNSKNGLSSYGYSHDLTLPQAYHLATLSKGIVSMRCGMLELLSSINVPKHCIYTKQRYQSVSSENMVKSSSLLKYPNVEKNTMFEYDTEKMPMISIIENICRNVK